MKTVSSVAYWVTNISNRNVTLADLALSIKAYSTVNLLDKKHYKYTLEQLEKSKNSGSIFNKKNIIKVRKVAPQEIKPASLPIQMEAIIPSRQRSVFNIKEEKFDELEIAEEKIETKSEEDKYIQEFVDEFIDK